MQRLCLKTLLEVLQSEKITLDFAKTCFDHLSIGVQDIEPYIHFKDAAYTRNLIFKNDSFEVLLICWDKGQATPIHDHNHSFGLMYGVQGALLEDVYPIVARGQAMEKSCTRDILPGRYTVISDEVGCHRLKNNSSGRSISLHLYAGPIQFCYAYRVKDASKIKRILHYLS